MKLLVERLLISNEHQIKYNSMSNAKKLKYIKKFLEQMPNAEHLKRAQQYFINHIFKNGFDDSKNILLKYMQAVPYDISSTTAQLVNTLLENETLSYNRAPWLVHKSLYTEDDASINFKIKALTYASNTSLQNTANVKVSYKDFMDSRGFIKSAQAIENKLKTIKTTTQVQIGSLNTDDLSDIFKKYNVSADKQKEFKKYLNDHKSEYTPFKKIDDLFNNWYNGGSDTAGNAPSTGKAILTQYLKTKRKPYDLQHIRDYVKEILPDKGTNLGDIQIASINEGDLDDELDTVLGKSYHSNIGREPIELLNSAIIKVVKDATNKALSGK